MHFANAGAYILALSAVAAGLLLCTDYVLVQLAWHVAGHAGRMIGYAAGRPRRAIRPSKRQPS